MAETRSKRLSIIRMITFVWLAVSGLQFVIWLMMVLIGWQFLFPFWVYTVVTGGVVLGALWIVESRRQSPHASRPERSE
jgi:hypothetical protein